MRYFWWFQSIITLIAIVLCFRGVGSHAVYVGAWILPMLVAAVFSSAFRADFCRRIGVWSQSPRKAAFYLVAVPTACLCLLNGRNISSYDNYGTNLLSANLALYGHTELSAVAGNCSQLGGVYYVWCVGGEVRSAYPVGTVVYSLPFFVTARLLGADLTNHGVIWHVAKWTASWIASAIVALSFLVALALVPFPVAWVMSALLATASGLLSTIGQGLWSHGGVTLSMMIGLWLVIRYEKEQKVWAAALLGFCWSLMFASRLTAAMLIAPFMLWVILIRPRWGIIAASFAALGLVPFGLYQHSVFGHPLGAQFLMGSAFARDFAITNYLEAGYGLLLSPGVGLLIYQPWIWVLLLWKWRVPIASEPKHWQLFCAAAIASHCLLAFSWHYWSGLIGWGTRYLSELLPLFALLCLPVLAGAMQVTTRRQVVVGLWLLGALIQANGVYLTGARWYHDPLYPQPNIEQRALDWRDPAFLYPLSHWLWGKR